MWKDSKKKLRFDFVATPVGFCRNYEIKTIVDLTGQNCIWLTDIDGHGGGFKAGYTPYAKKLVGNSHLSAKS